MSYQNNRMLNTICRKPVDATPVWLMRQAGRYLPEYRRLRQQAKTFMNLCKCPELACEVTLQPIHRFDLDAAIIFSDILTIPDAMGLGLSFKEGKGPYFKYAVQNETDIAKLSTSSSENLAYVYEAIKLVKQELKDKIPLIGFCGSPWTIAAYMVEGQSRSGFPKIMHLLQNDSLDNINFLNKLLNLLSDAISVHLNEQIKAGADIVMLFDTWGGLLNTNQYALYSLKYLQKIICQLMRTYHHKKIPVILFTKNGNSWLEAMAETTCDVIGLDWQISLTEARERLGDKVCLQGNLNPSSLLKMPDEIRTDVAQILQAYGSGGGHIFNLGHGITPDVPPEHVAALVDAVHELSPIYHNAA